MKIEVSAEKRKLQGKGASRRLRKSGKVPAVVYGGDQSAESIITTFSISLKWKLFMRRFYR